MIRNNIAYSVLIPLAFLILAGCRKQQLPELPGAETDSGTYLCISVVLDPEVETRSPSPGENGDGLEPGIGAENVVNDLNVFLFQGGEVVEDGQVRRPGINAENAQEIRITSLYLDKSDMYQGPSSDKCFFLKDIAYLRLEPGTYDMLVIANADRNIGLWVSPTASLRWLQDYLIGGSNILKYNEDGSLAYVMMSSESDASVTLDHNPIYDPAYVEVRLERMAARVDCSWQESYDVGNGDKAMIEGIAVVNRYNSSSYAFKHVSENTESSRPMIRLGEEKVSDGVASNYVLTQIFGAPVYPSYFDSYLPETDWSLDSEWTDVSQRTSYSCYVMESVSAERLILDDGLEARCTGLLFKVRYLPSGKEEDARYCYYIYWIRHADDGNETEIGPMEYAVVRNNVYKVNITGIAGEGPAEPVSQGMSAWSQGGIECDVVLGVNR